MTPKIGMLYYNCHFEMLTPIKILVLIFLHFFGDCQSFPWSVELSLQQQQDELDDDSPLMPSPYVGEGRWRRDRRVPRPTLRHP